MAGEPKKVTARFYRSASGAEPVRDWLLELAKEERKEIGKDIATVEYGWPIGMPTCAPLGAGLYEVRTNLAGNRIARVLFCFASGSLVLLHGFFKKTRKTPQADLELARQRQREVVR
jgi:phage-related protein